MNNLRELIEKIGINDLVLETDSPYLSPEPFRGKQNNPYNVYYVLNKIFEITGIDKNKILEVTNSNVISIFDI